MADNEEYRVLIIGGGPAGRLSAQALQMEGAKVTVFEQDSALDARPRDWDFGIYWAQDPLAECIPEELQKDVEDCQVDQHRAGPDELMRIYNGQTEELMKALPIPYNIRLNRRKFLRLLGRGLDIQYSKKIKEVSSDGTRATATFEDGSTATGNLLIGAEGAHSVVREYLLGHEKAALQPLPLISTGTIAKLPTEALEKFQELTYRLCFAFHPKGTFSWVGIHDAPKDSKPVDWEFMILLSRMEPDDSYDPKSLQNEEALADLKQRHEVFGDRFRQIFQSIPEGTRCYHNRLSYWLPEPWDNHNGTVTLLGDSAHPMTYHRGQGLNNTIRDVYDISRSVKEHGLTSKAVDEYEKEMIPRGREAVSVSNANSLAIHDWEKLLQSPLFKSGLKQKLEEE